jgi:hypothetical protein
VRQFAASPLSVSSAIILNSVRFEVAPSQEVGLGERFSVDREEEKSKPGLSLCQALVDIRYVFRQVLSCWRVGFVQRACFFDAGVLVGKRGPK